MSSAYCVHILSHHADPYIPYTVEVRAATSAGASDPNTQVIFTKEDGKHMWTTDVSYCSFSIIYCHIDSI